MSRDNTKHGCWLWYVSLYSRSIQWHIHAGSWSLVNWWREGKTLPYIGCSWILMNAAVGHMNGSALMVIGVSAWYPDNLEKGRLIRRIREHIWSFNPDDGLLLFESAWNIYHRENSSWYVSQQNKVTVCGSHGSHSRKCSFAFASITLPFLLWTAPQRSPQMSLPLVNVKC